jgi:hypothetical protein
MPFLKTEDLDIGAPLGSYTLRRSVRFSSFERRATLRFMRTRGLVSWLRTSMPMVMRAPAMRRIQKTQRQPIRCATKPGWESVLVFRA